MPQPGSRDRNRISVAPASSSLAVRAVLFDLYGTLIDITVDTSRPEIWEHLAGELARVGITASAGALRRRYWELVVAEERAHGQPFVLDPLIFSKLAQIGGRAVPQQVSNYLGRIFRELTTHTIRLRPYAIPLLTVIRESGCKAGVVSNTEETVTRHDLRKLKLETCWDTMVLSATVGVKKPDPEIFHIALRNLGINAQQAVFIGDDRAADFEGAKRAGITPVLLCPITGKSPFACTNPQLECILASLQRCGWRSSLSALAVDSGGRVEASRPQSAVAPRAARRRRPRPAA